MVYYVFTYLYAMLSCVRDFTKEGKNVKIKKNQKK
ncbi:hypothetical protein T08_2593 [Trichinella sp. T8]|nr:hypothetical protein T08_2593 [Trichinella sp. T8]